MANTRSLTTLLIVEGEKEEPRYLRMFSEAFAVPYEICIYGTNIYDLFRRLERDRNEHDGVQTLNIKDVLAEREKDPERRQVLSDTEFAYTYLVFDSDLHHHSPQEDAPPVEQSIRDNVPILRRMLEMFTDETDETVGKLYVNYPMAEAWRDADSCFDASYQDAGVSVEDVRLYKKMVAHRHLAGFGDRFSRDQLRDILRMMLHKLNFLHTNQWKVPHYAGYRIQSDGVGILGIEERLMQTERRIAALNTSIFLPIDYFGQNLYQSIAKDRS